MRNDRSESDSAPELPNGNQSTALANIEDLSTELVTDMVLAELQMNSTPVDGTNALFITPTQTLDPFFAMIYEYKHNVHHIIPILPSDDLQFELSIRNASPFLVSAILSASYPEASCEPQIPNIDMTLPDIQAAALLTLAHYGRKEYREAKMVIMVASSCLVKLNVSSIDHEDSLQTLFSADDLAMFEM